MGADPQVGFAGFAMGGGFNDMLSGMYGLAASHVQEALLILANGKIVRATRNNEYKDLLWGLLGYGGGRLALMLQFTIGLIEDQGIKFSYIHWKRQYCCNP